MARPIRTRATKSSRGFAAGEVEVIVNCAVFTEGFDLPDIGRHRPGQADEIAGIISADGWPWASGRPMARPDCIVLDHAGSVFLDTDLSKIPSIGRSMKTGGAETPAQVARELTPATSRLLTCTSLRRRSGPRESHARNAAICRNVGGEHLDVGEGELEGVDRNGKRHPDHHDDRREAGILSRAPRARSEPWAIGLAPRRIDIKARSATWPSSRMAKPGTEGAERRGLGLGSALPDPICQGRCRKAGAMGNRRERGIGGWKAHKH